MQPSEIDQLTFRDLQEWIFVERDENSRPKLAGHQDGDDFSMFANVWKKRGEVLGLEVNDETCKTLFMWHMDNENEHKGDPERWKKIVCWLIPGFEEAAHGRQD